MTKPTGADPLLFEFFSEIGIIEQLARARLERELPHGLTMSQFKVLNHFVRLGGENSPAGLARAFQVTKGAMTNALQKLETKGFIGTKGDPRDGRGKLVHITQAGRAARDASIAALAPQFPFLLSELSEGEFRQALPFLRRLRIFLDENRNVRAVGDTRQYSDS